MNWWQEFLKWISDNKEALGWLFGSGVVLAILGRIYKLIVWGFNQQRIRKTRSLENFPFQIIYPNSDVSKIILGDLDDNAFSDRNIPYQQRIIARSIKNEIENILKDSRWIIVTGRTGIGKTREIINVAQHLNNNGWTILYLTRDKWLEAPSMLPKGVPDKKLLFILDDLNRKMYASRVEQSPKANNAFQPLFVPLQKRLLETLKTYETLCGKSEIYVLATARDEKVNVFESEQSEWEKLEIEKYSELWKGFRFYDLPIPSNDVVAKFIKETSNQIKIKVIDENTIAHLNDGTFLNIVENLRIAHNNKPPLAKENFRNTLKGTWEKCYRDNIKLFQTGKYIYDAVDLLRLRGFDLNQDVIARVVKIIIRSSLAFPRRFRYYFLVNKELKQLIQLENITQPRDGQIEAKGYRIDEEPYLYFLSKVALEQAAYIDILPFPLKILNKAFFNILFAIMNLLSLFPLKDRESFLKAFYYYAISMYYYRFERYTEALELLSLALKNDLGLDALNFIIRKRIAMVLTRQGRYRDAIKAFNGLNINRKFAALRDLGIAHLRTGNFASAIVTLERGIKFMPMDPLMQITLAEAYIKKKDFGKAKILLSKSTRMFPRLARVYSLFAVCLQRLGEKDNFERAREQANKLAKYEDDYVRACVAALYGDTERSIELLTNALQEKQISKDIIRNDPHFDNLKQKTLFRSSFITKRM